MAKLVFFKNHKRIKGDRTYYFQEGQIIQTPDHANVKVTVFRNGEADYFELNMPYEADPYWYFSEKKNAEVTGWKNIRKLAE